MAYKAEASAPIVHMSDRIPRIICECRQDDSFWKGGILWAFERSTYWAWSGVANVLCLLYIIHPVRPTSTKFDVIIYNGKGILWFKCPRTQMSGSIAWVTDLHCTDRAHHC